MTHSVFLLVIVIAINLPLAALCKDETSSTHRFTPADEVNKELMPVGSDTAFSEFEAAIKQHRAGAFTSAIDGYRKVLKIYPDCFPAHYNLGLCWEEKMNWQEAHKEFQSAANIQPLHREAYKHLWFLALKRGNKGDAVMYRARYSEL
jgi:tetratricopeptide (TPR) repeat protein